MEREGGRIWPAAHTLEQTQIYHVTLKQHHHPLPILHTTSLPFREEGDLSPLQEEGSVEMPLLMNSNGIMGMAKAKLHMEGDTELCVRFACLILVFQL